jgi:uncharacterized membrane protein
MEGYPPMNLYVAIKVLHIISSTVLFGTGMGIAFFMLRSMFTDNLHEKLFAARNTVLADYFFTLPAVIIQPLTGFVLVWMAGFDLTSFWILATLVIYLIAGICWLPVVWIQIQLKSMCQEAVDNGTALPERYHRLFRLWFLLGWPAFIGLVVVFYLMVAKPV